jgi:hypothetical protein
MFGVKKIEEPPNFSSDICLQFYLIFKGQNTGLSIVSSLKIKDMPPDTKLNIFEDPHLCLEDVLCKIYTSPLRTYMFKEGAFFQRRGYDTLC